MFLSQEMYPPKVHQFAYVTDEACTEDEILSMEIIVMKVKRTTCLGLNRPLSTPVSSPVRHGLCDVIRFPLVSQLKTR